MRSEKAVADLSAGLGPRQVLGNLAEVPATGQREWV